MSTTRHPRRARGDMECRCGCSMNIPPEVPAVICTMAIAIGAYSSFRVLFTTLFGNSNPLPSEQDRTSVIAILVLHVLLGPAMFLGVTGIVRKRLGVMLLYCALLYTDMLVNIVTGLGVVRHIYQATGAEGMSKAHRDIKFLIEIYWILELFTASLYTICVAKLCLVGKKEHAWQNIGAESASLCRLLLVKWTVTTDTTTIFEVVYGFPRRVRQIYRGRRPGRRSADASDADSVSTTAYHPQ